ncbi:hypothetical protein [Campylobacter sp. RM16192]|uniref:hypothetical protein n=1 Tax=Campylobacter sp. RM16192 TaxID=1660080 RepID=UPI0014522A5A|nr:hypothetical protein [Campylobacter sp. RM16192]QCD52729.1 putative excinuclease, ATPase subunit [Campylobacter sp. RM16192]
MKKLIALAVFSVFALGKDQIFYHNIADALNLKRASEYVRSDFIMEFSKQHHEELKSIKVNGSTIRYRDKPDNMFNKDYQDEEPKVDYTKSCYYAFLAALRNLQKVAEKNGSKTIVNIQGNFKNEIYDSRDKFQCAVGGTKTTVALRADLKN